MQMTTRCALGSSAWCVLTRPGGWVIERATLLAGGTALDGAVAWIEAHGGIPEMPTCPSAQRGLHTQQRARGGRRPASCCPLTASASGRAASPRPAGVRPPAPAAGRPTAVAVDY